MEAWRLIRACFSSVTLDVRALTMVVNPMLVAEAMTDEERGELGEVVSSTWRLLEDHSRLDLGVRFPGPEDGD